MIVIQSRGDKTNNPWELSFTPRQGSGLWGKKKRLMTVNEIHTKIKAMMKA
jgi:hypothetical protein